MLFLKKSDLIPGRHIVEMRNGKHYLVQDDGFYNYSYIGEPRNQVIFFVGSHCVNEDMYDADRKLNDFDIVKVYSVDDEYHNKECNEIVDMIQLGVIKPIWVR